MKPTDSKDQNNLLEITVENIDGKPAINLNGENQTRKIEDNDVDAIIAKINLNPNVTSIDLSNNNLTGRGFITLLRGLADNEALTNIDLSNNNIAIFETLQRMPVTSIDLERNVPVSEEVTEENGLLAMEEKASKPSIEGVSNERTSEWGFSPEEKRNMRNDLHNLAMKGGYGLIAAPVNDIIRDSRVLASNVHYLATGLYNFARVEAGNLARINNIKDVLENTVVSSLNLVGNPCKQNSEFNDYWSEIETYLSYNKEKQNGATQQPAASENKSAVYSSTTPLIRPRVSTCSRLGGNVGIVLNACAII